MPWWVKGKRKNLERGGRAPAAHNISGV